MKNEVTFQQPPKVLAQHFTNHNDYLEYLVEEIMLQLEFPVGAWTLKNELEKLEVNVATATIGRLLNSLDNKGYCDKISNKGRCLSPLGERQTLLTRGRVETESLSADIVDSVRVQHFDDLIELLYTRMVLEREAIRLAAQNATEQDLEKMDAALKQHRLLRREKLDDSHAGLDFHALVVDAAKNKCMSAIIRLLAHEEHQLEAKYPLMNVTNHAIEFIGVHEEMRDAIARRDADTAAKMMEEHLLYIIELMQKEQTGF